MGDSIYIAANCFVPLTDVDMAIATWSIKLMPCFLSLHRFSEADELKHTPEDDDNVWISGIYKVPNELIATMVQVFRGLPYFQTLTFPDKRAPLDETMQLSSHPRFKVQSVPHNEVHGEESSSVQGSKENINTAAQSEQTAEPVGLPTEPDSAVDQQPQLAKAMIQSKQSKVTAQAQQNEQNDIVTSPAEQQHTVVHPNEQIVIAAERTKQIDSSTQPTTQTTADMRSSGHAGSQPPPALSRPKIKRVNAVGPPRRVPSFLGRIDGLWRQLQPYESPDNYRVPSQAFFTALSTLSKATHSSPNKVFFLANLVGKIRKISPPCPEPNENPRYLFWEVELLELGRSRSENILKVYIYNVDAKRLCRGQSHGMAEGDLVLAFNVPIDVQSERQCESGVAVEQQWEV
ncbi:uncharacterized protein UTRI_05164_B [Ustilago trichophora]|uniref:Uncharacterized protein n=1 Tax=Ustilago trichophora TaxID=86804 RepID=A0A5C3EGJ5_9BASI|nr:uncharacterized protein UTRI_05164_B [Ustilago trichophora]